MRYFFIPVCTKVLKKAAKKAKKLFHLTIELIQFEVTVVSVPFQTFYGQMKQTKTKKSFLAANTFGS